MSLKVEGEKIDSTDELYEHFSDLVPEKWKNEFLEYTMETDKQHKTVAIAFYYIESGKSQEKVADKFNITTSPVSEAAQEICYKYNIEYPVDKRYLEKEDGEIVSKREISEIKKKIESKEEKKGHGGYEREDIIEAIKEAFENTSGRLTIGKYTSYRFSIEDANFKFPSEGVITGQDESFFELKREAGVLIDADKIALANRRKNKSVCAQCLEPSEKSVKLEVSKDQVKDSKGCCVAETDNGYVIVYKHSENAEVKVGI